MGVLAKEEGSGVSLRKEEGQESPAENPAVCVVLKEGRGIGDPEYDKRDRDVLKRVECHEEWK